MSGQAEFDLPGIERGKRTEHVEYGERALVTTSFGRKGSVSPRPNDWNPYDGAYYEGGPKVFEPVKRTIVTYTRDWEPI